MSDKLITVFTSQGYMETPYESHGLLSFGDNKMKVTTDPLKFWYIMHRWAVLDRDSFIKKTEDIIKSVDLQYRECVNSNISSKDLYDILIDQGYFIEQTDWSKEKATMRLFRNGKYIPVFETETYKKLGKYALLFKQSALAYKYYLFPFLLPVEERRILNEIKTNFKYLKKTEFNILLNTLPDESKLIKILDSLYRKRCIYIFGE